jgi:hypothetical protein
MVETQIRRREAVGLFLTTVLFARDLAVVARSDAEAQEIVDFVNDPAGQQAIIDLIAEAVTGGEANTDLGDALQGAPEGRRSCKCPSDIEILGICQPPGSRVCE